VLPLDDRFQERWGTYQREMEQERTSYTYYPGTVRIPESNAPHVKNRSHVITAEVEIPASGAEGPICAIGGVGNGWSLYIKDRRLVYCYNYASKRSYIRSTVEIPTAKKVKFRFEFERTGKEKFGDGGIGKLYIDGSKVGEGTIPKTVKFGYTLDEPFDIGRDSGSPVTDEYKAEAEFTGTIKKVVIDLIGDKHHDREAETRIAMKRQ